MALPSVRVLAVTSQSRCSGPLAPFSSTLDAPYLGFRKLTMWLFHRNFTSFTSPTSSSASRIFS
ncbi:hypothetical protein EYF80_044145 [Liparis tanakae]|uniref:Uncharacterized protein n=1 Tax=Liparis tanakae TaxID=230148 RepID=A0A4Z2FWP5_9TELE|nr:hypothetical protein EYF80_044145 [Liparis tanakae]